MITEKIHSLRESLKQRQMRSTNKNVELFEEEKNVRMQLEKWTIIEESIYRQKLRVQRLKLRNSNTSYFFANTKGRKAQNQIRMFKSVDEEIIKRLEGIQAETVGFYQQILGSAVACLAAIHPRIMKEGLVLSRIQQLQLIKPFTKEELVLTLKGIDDLKAPREMVSVLSFSRKHCMLLGMRLLK